MSDVDKRIGIISPPETVERYVEAFRRAGAEAAEVRESGDLDGLDGVLISGFESESLGAEMVESGMSDTLRSFFYTGGAVWGMGAGMVVAASTALGERQPLLGLMNAIVERDGFGVRFRDTLDVEGFDEPVVGEFDHAPYFEMIGPGVESIAEYDEKIVAALGENILVTAFYPEPAEDVRFYRYFIEEVCST